MMVTMIIILFICGILVSKQIRRYCSIELGKKYYYSHVSEHFDIDFNELIVVMNANIICK